MKHFRRPNEVVWLPPLAVIERDMQRDGRGLDIVAGISCKRAAIIIMHGEKFIHSRWIL
jgi:hypothetical protein